LQTNKVIKLINTYQRLGHLISNTEPIKTPKQYRSLGRLDIEKTVEKHLTLEFNGLSQADLEDDFMIYTDNMKVNIIYKVLKGHKRRK